MNSILNIQEYTGIYKETDSRKIVIYTQVSTSDPKGDLKN